MDQLSYVGVVEAGAQRGRCYNSRQACRVETSVDYCVILLVRYRVGGTSRAVKKLSKPRDPCLAVDNQLILAGLEELTMLPT